MNAEIEAALRLTTRRLEFILDGIRRGKMKDQSILDTSNEEAQSMEVMALSDLIAGDVKIARTALSAASGRAPTNKEG